ncbi:MAG TPA: hypothetical protein VM282_09740 [Acidimicrobiales bacterium]|nr:hypothetical protein [Acidimicrobiales bacterium]
MTDLEIDELINGCKTGRTLTDLATEFGVHRRTAAAHLETRGISRRVNHRKMTDDVSEAMPADDGYYYCRL